MTTLRPSYPRFVPILLLAFGLAIHARPSALALQPQPSDDPSLNLVDHLRTHIRSDDTALREYALMDVTALANCTGTCSIRLRTLAGRRLRIQNNTGITTMVDLSGLVPDLLWVYGTGPSDGLRVLALAGLIHIGNEASLELLIVARRDVSPFVEEVTQRSIAAFFLERYPHLESKGEEPQLISLADIRRARAQNADVDFTP